MSKKKKIPFIGLQKILIEKLGTKEQKQKLKKEL